MASYAEKQYKLVRDALPMIQQSFDEVKKNLMNFEGWNKDVYEIDGLTMRMSGDMLNLYHHHVVVGTPETLASREDNKMKFLKDVKKEIEKLFKKKTKVKLTLTKKEEDVSFEKMGRISAETSWLLSVGAGQHSRAVGKYLVRDMIGFKIKIVQK